MNGSSRLERQIDAEGTSGGGEPRLGHGSDVPTWMRGMPVSLVPKMPAADPGSAPVSPAVAAEPTAAERQPVTLGDLPPRVAELLNQQIALSGIFGGRPLMAGDEVPDAAMRWLEKRGSLDSAQIAALGWVDSAEAEPASKPVAAPGAAPAAQESLENFDALVAAASSFDDLIAVANQIPFAVFGDQFFFRQDSLATLLETLRQTGVGLSKVPEMYGLRAKAEALLAAAAAAPATPETQASPAERVAAATNWAELQAAVAAIPEIQGSRQTFTGAEMAEVVQQASVGLPLVFLTRTFGIRDKAIELRAAAEAAPAPVDAPAAPDAPPAVERPLTPEEAMEKSRLDMEAAREAFIPLHQDYLRGTRHRGFLTRARDALGLGPRRDTAQAEAAAELPPELAAAKARYEAAKVGYGRQLYGESMRHVAPGDAIAEPAARALVFNQVFANEYALLQQAEAETWPPKEKSVFRKALDWYRRRGPVTRALVSTSLVTGGALAGGAVAGVGAAALFAGARFVRTAVGMGTGLLAGKAFDKIFRPGKAAETAEARAAELRRVFGLGTGFDSEENFRAMDREYRNIQEDRKVAETRRAFGKALVMVGASFGAGYGVSKIEGLFASGVTAAPAASPKVGAGYGDSEWKAPETAAPGLDDGDDGWQPVEGSAPAGTSYADSGWKAPEAPEPLPSVPVEDISADEEMGIVPPAEPALPTFGDLKVPVTPDADNVWAMVKAKLDGAGLLRTLPTRGQQNNLIDALYQKFVHMSPSQLRAIGIPSGNVHVIAGNAKVDLSAAFGNPADVAKAYEHAGGLSHAEIAPIEADAAALDSFRAAHPNTGFTEGLANRLVLERRGR